MIAALKGRPTRQWIQLPTVAPLLSVVYHFSVSGKMKLLLSQNLDGYHTACENPTADEIRKHVESLDWQTLSGAKIETDPTRWIEMSGSDNDGYSIIYSDSENEWISKEEPEDRDHCITTLQAYASGDKDWMELFSWNHFNKLVDGKYEKKGCFPVIMITLLLGSILAYSTIERNDANQSFHTTPAIAPR